MPAETLAPQLVINRSADGLTIVPRGLWNVQGLAQGRGGKGARAQVLGLKEALAAHRRDPQAHWDLTQTEAFDHVGALMFWRAWGHARPQRLLIDEGHDTLFSNFSD